MENPHGYDTRHGGPFDRGSADAYYRRPYSPHYFKGMTHSSERVEECDMTSEEIAAYTYAYYNETDRNQWD